MRRVPAAKWEDRALELDRAGENDASLWRPDYKAIDLLPIVNQFRELGIVDPFMFVEPGYGFQLHWRFDRKEISITFDEDGEIELIMEIGNHPKQSVRVVRPWENRRILSSEDLNLFAEFFKETVGA